MQVGAQVVMQIGAQVGMQVVTYFRAYLDSNNIQLSEQIVLQFFIYIIKMNSIFLIPSKGPSAYIL